MKLPAQYAWLAAEPGPRMIVEALKLYGTLETPGAGNNPVIMGWARACDLGSVYTADAVPWCGLFMAYVARQAGKVPPPGPLWALNWAKFGKDVGQPCLGDVLTVTRSGGGHVGLYVGEDLAAFHLLGGNTADSVSVARIDKKRLYRARRPFYNVQPANVRPVILAPTGELSRNEA